MFGVAAKAQEVVDLLLGKRKSEGCVGNTLRFIYKGDLLRLCGEEG